MFDMKPPLAYTCSVMLPEQESFKLTVYPMQEILDHVDMDNWKLPEICRKNEDYLKTIVAWQSALEISKLGDLSAGRERTIDESRINAKAIEMYSFFRRFMPKEYIEDYTEDEAYGHFVDDCAEALRNLISTGSNFDKPFESRKARVFERLVLDIYDSRGL